MQNNDNKLLSGYQRMMTRVKDALDTPATLTLREHIEAAKEKAIALEELTVEEAERIGHYLFRDLQDAAHYLSETEQGLKEWARFDLALIEDKLLDMFSFMVDHTRSELDAWAERARLATEWMSGEVTGPGTLQCDNCQHSLQFTQPAYIPVCPNCGATLFKRVMDTDDEAVS
ncbi:zinc ribbon-containing protein [Beggiatoa leptomitoformis]|nr:zinc ribbon-containing protein [Beggiatoa leptomitoformis]